MKTCPKCLQTKSKDSFYPKKYKNGTVGLRSYCKDCSTQDRNTWRKSSSKDNERNKAYNKQNAAKIRGNKLVKNYWPNLTWQEANAEWDKIYRQQDGKCAFGHTSKKLHVDHCHKTGVVRGLLCYNCNNGLGRFKDDIEILEKAIVYLTKSRHKVAS